MQSPTIFGTYLGVIGFRFHTTSCSPIWALPTVHNSGGAFECPGFAYLICPQSVEPLAFLNSVHNKPLAVCRLGVAHAMILVGRFLHCIPLLSYTKYQLLRSQSICNTVQRLRRKVYCIAYLLRLSPWQSCKARCRWIPRVTGSRLRPESVLFGILQGMSSHTVGRQETIDDVAPSSVLSLAGRSVEWQT